MTATTAQAQDHRLEFVLEPPLAVTAGEVFSVQVAACNVDDDDDDDICDEGEADDDFNPNIVLSLLGGGELSGSTSLKVESDGVARFEGLRITQPGTHRIIATGGSATPDTSREIFVASVGATRLEFVQEPSTTPAGASITPAVTVRAVTDFGATDPTFRGNVTVAIGTNPAGGTLSGTTTIAAVDGVATFSNLSIDRAGSGYTLTASADGLAGDTSASFSITPGAASGATSQITASPSSIPANGTSTSTITVELRDAAGTPLASGGDAVALSTTSGTLGPVTDNGNGTYTATLTASSTAQTATVSGTVNGAAIGDTAEVTFTPLAPVATRLVFGQQPSNAQAGATISPAVTVRAVDDAGATATEFTGNVTIAIGTNPSGGTLSGTTTVAAVSGVATFGNLSIDRTGTGYTLAASATGLTGATSSAFSITTGPPSTATSTITASPTSVPANGSSTSLVTVQLRDASGNPLTSGGATVELFTTAGTFGPVTDRGDGTYTGTLTAPSSTSTATATIRGTVGGALIADTATVTFTGVSPGANRLVFGQQPSNAQAGAAISPPVTVQVVDNGGATDPTFTGPVTIAIGSNPSNGVLSGTTTVNAVSGVATFANLSIDRAGTGYRLAASAPGASGITSAPFAITPGPPSAATSTISALPTSIPANGSSTSTITVDVRDASGNRRTGGGDTVSLSTTSGTLSPVTDLGNGLYTATLTSSSSPGTATISGRVAGATITDTATVVFTSSNPTVTRLAFGVQPRSTQEGAVISPAVTVRAVDAGGTTVSSFNGPVTIAIGSNPSGGTLSGTTTVAAVSGVATFANLAIDEAGGGYTLTASSPGLIATTSNPFSITTEPTSGSTDLAVTASVDDATPAVGDTVVYTIRVTNQGSQQATSVEVTYELDARLAFVSSVPSQGNYDPQQGVWTVGSLDPAEGATLEIEARVQR